MLHRSFLICALASLSMLASNSKGDEIGFKFSGETIFIPGEVFGHFVPVATPVSGLFVYESENEATHEPSTCDDCLGYLQELSNGFSLNLGDVKLRTSEYVVSITNDGPGRLPGTMEDALAVRWSSTDVDPPLTMPLYVDGVGFATGELRVSLVGDSELFPDTSLPTDPDPSDFVLDKGGFVTEAEDGSVDIIVRIDMLDRFEIIPGDFDHNEAVDYSDYLIWKASLGSIADLSADGNRNGAVDAADYAVWLSHLGSAATDTNSQTIETPEPATIWLCVALSVSLGLRAPNGVLRTWRVLAEA